MQNDIGLENKLLFIAKTVNFWQACWYVGGVTKSIRNNSRLNEEKFGSQNPLRKGNREVPLHSPQESESETNTIVHRVIMFYNASNSTLLNAGEIL